MPIRNLWDRGVALATNPSLFKVLKHSRFLDPFRRSSKSRLLKGGVGIATSFIPIPGVRGLIKGALDKAVDITRNRAITQNKKDADGLKAEDVAKWGLKDLDVSDFDRYRWKIYNAGTELGTVMKNVEKNRDTSVSPCNDIGMAIAKLLYLKKRAVKLRTKAMATMALCETTLKWLEEVDGVAVKGDKETQDTNSKYSNNESVLKGYIAEESDPRSVNDNDHKLRHVKCDDAMCIYTSDVRKSEHFRGLQKGVSTVAAFFVNRSDNTDHD